jgi:hypothetical protein
MSNEAGDETGGGFPRHHGVQGFARTSGTGHIHIDLRRVFACISRGIAGGDDYAMIRFRKALNSVYVMS